MIKLARLPVMTGKSARKSWGPSLRARTSAARAARRPPQAVRPGRRRRPGRRPPGPGWQTRRMRITLLAGGVGGARFLRGLRVAAPDAEITVIGNTGDDITLFGLHVCPDLDTVMYTLGGGISEEQGWGRADETHAVQSELTAYGAGPDWFRLGDRDFATHIARTSMLSAGLPLSAVTRQLCERWQPGVTLLPMTDDDVQTHVVIDDEAGSRTVHFQEWWVRLHAKVPALSFIASGADESRAGARRPGGDRGRRLRAAAAVQPGGQHRRHPGHPGDRRGGPGQDGRRRLARDRRRAGPRHGRCLPGRDRGQDVGRRCRRALRSRPARRLAGGLVRRGRRGDRRGHRPRRDRGPGAAAVHDRRRDDRGDRPGGDRPGHGARADERAHRHRRCPGCRRSPPGATWPS